MYEDLIRASGRVKEPKDRPVNFGPFNGGLVTSRPPHMLARAECVEMVNMVIGPDGIPKTRPGTSEIGTIGLTSHTINSVKDIRVGGTWYTIASVTTGTTYKVYYITGAGAFIQIGNDTMFEGEVSFIGFNNFLMLFDGGYAKFWDGTTVKFLSDDGIGAKPSSSYIYENLDGDIYDIKPIIYRHEMLMGDAEFGSTSKQAVVFTTPSINANFSLPSITFTIKMARVGNGTTTADEPIKAVIRNSSTQASIKSKDFMLPELLPVVGVDEDYFCDPADYDDVSITFTEDDVSFSPNTTYWFCLEYEYGDSVTEHYPVILSSIHLDETNYRYYYSTFDVAWFSSDAVAICADVICNFPPKLEYGVEHNKRVFGIEGATGDNPNYLWYCGAGNHLDWSSENFGGYLEAGFQINAIASFYDLFLFGSEKNPGLKRMTGATPASYALSDSIQAISANQKSLVVTPDDLMFLHSSGASSIQTIQEYGDVRSHGRSDNILPTILSYYDSSALAAYEPRYGLYLLSLNDGSGDSLYVLHTKNGQRRYPVSKWSFAGGETISSLSQGESCVYIGTTAGNVYKVDYTTLKDDGSYPSYSLKSRVFLNQHINANAIQYYAMLSSNGNGGSVDFNLYRNQSTTALQSETITLPTDLSGTQPDSGAAYLRAFGRKRLNFDFWALQVSFENIVPVSDNPIYFGDIQVLAR